MNSNNSASGDGADYKCCLCQDTFYKPVTLECGHSTCEACLTEYFVSFAGKCPLCRAELKSKIKVPKVNIEMWNHIQQNVCSNLAVRKSESQEVMQNVVNLRIDQTRTILELVCNTFILFKEQHLNKDVFGDLRVCQFENEAITEAFLETNTRTFIDLLQSNTQSLMQKIKPIESSSISQNNNISLNNSISPIEINPIRQINPIRPISPIDEDPNFEFVPNYDGDIDDENEDDNNEDVEVVPVINFTLLKVRQDFVLFLNWLQCWVQFCANHDSNKKIIKRLLVEDKDIGQIDTLLRLSESFNTLDINTIEEFQNWKCKFQSKLLNVFKFILKGKDDDQQNDGFWNTINNLSHLLSKRMKKIKSLAILYSHFTVLHNNSKTNQSPSFFTVVLSWFAFIWNYGIQQFGFHQWHLCWIITVLIYFANYLYIIFCLSTNTIVARDLQIERILINTLTSSEFAMMLLHPTVYCIYKVHRTPLILFQLFPRCILVSVLALTVPHLLFSKYWVIIVPLLFHLIFHALQELQRTKEFCATLFQSHWLLVLGGTLGFTALFQIETSVPSHFDYIYWICLVEFVKNAYVILTNPLGVTNLLDVNSLSNIRLMVGFLLFQTIVGTITQCTNLFVMQSIAPLWITNLALFRLPLLYVLATVCGVLFCFASFFRPLFRCGSLNFVRFAILCCSLYPKQLQLE